MNSHRTLVTAALAAVLGSTYAAPAAQAETASEAAGAAQRWTLVVERRFDRVLPSPATPAVGVARIAFRVDAQGRASDIAIERSSGSALLDKAALDGVHALGVLPTPPAIIAGRLIRVDARFEPSAGSTLAARQAHRQFAAQEAERRTVQLARQDQPVAGR